MRVAVPVHAGSPAVGRPVSVAMMIAYYVFSTAHEKPKFVSPVRVTFLIVLIPVTPFPMPVAVPVTRMVVLQLDRDVFLMIGSIATQVISIQAKLPSFPLISVMKAVGSEPERDANREPAAGACACRSAMTVATQNNGRAGFGPATNMNPGPAHHDERL